MALSNPLAPIAVKQYRNVSMQDDYDLVDGCRRQDRFRQRQLYELFAGKLFIVCQRYVRRTEEAEDVLQDAFVKIFQHIHTFRFECPLEAWMKRIVINTALKYLQKQKPWQYMSDADSLAPVLPQADQSVPLLNYQSLLLLIQELPPGCRIVFNLYVIEGYSHAEISALLDIAEGTSKSQLARARALLQQKLRQDEAPLKNFDI